LRSRSSGRVELKVRNLFQIFTPLVAAGALCVGASGPARAQAAAEGAQAAPSRAAKYDEYGNLRHCDMSARLDNFVIEMQSNPTAKAFVVSYDAKGKKRGYANRSLKISRHYLVNVRGLEPERLVAVDGGSKEVEEGATELWVVPEGAEPPVASPAVDRYAAKDFSGKFDSYFTDAQTYKVFVGMGYDDSEIAYTDFAEKLKGQPDSVGYLVVRAPEGGLRGEWRRVGRRDEQILAKDYGVEAGRLKTLYGGRSEGELAEVEFWILPKNAPPPASLAEEPAKKPKAAVRLNRLDPYGSLDRDAERWMLENIAEALRDDPRASAYIVARDEIETEVEEGGPGEETGGAEEESGETTEAEAGESAAEGEEEGDDAGGEEEEGIEGTASEFAERWKDILVNKYGIEAHRVVVLEGRPAELSGGRVTTWLVPENAPRPDPFARDEDDPKVEVLREGGGDAETAATPPPS
jgi:hypothetical protein